MNKIAKGFLIGSGAAVATATALSAVSYSMTNSIVKVALDRQLIVKPNIKYKKFVSGCRQMELIDRLCTENAKKLEHGDCRTVSMRARDGTRLAGHLHLCPNAKRTVIAMHGWRTSWARDFGAVSEFFHSNDCNVLYVEQRAQNNSDGEYIGFGLIERFDCIDWINYINNVQGMSALPIYLCGVSMGATTVLMATEFSLPKNVVGVIADCGFTSPLEIWRHVVNKNMHLFYNSIHASLVRSMCKRRIDIEPSHSTVDALKKCKIPVLFVHGAEDRFVPIEMTYKNYKACASEKRLFVVPDAEHGMCYFTDKKGYEAEVKRFWQDNDNIK